MLNAQLCLDVRLVEQYGPYRQPEQVDPMVRQLAAEMNRISVELNTWLDADLRPLNPLDPPAIDRLNAIHTPALIMAGALDDPEILRAARVMTDAIEGAKKHSFSQSACPEYGRA